MNTPTDCEARIATLEGALKEADVKIVETAKWLRSLAVETKDETLRLSMCQVASELSAKHTNAIRHALRQ